MTFRKNDLVVLNEDTCFGGGGGIRFLLPRAVENGKYKFTTGLRTLSEEEQDEWKRSDAAKEMTDSGETKLCPKMTREKIYCDDVLTVVRARSNPPYISGAHGYCLIRLTDGKEIFVKRVLLKKL